MVKNPINWINKCIFAGASRIVGQVEMMEDREMFVKLIKDEGLEAGLAFDIETEIDNIPQETDIILLMGRKAGFGIYPFNDRVLNKIDEAKKYGKMVAVDGGVNTDNIRLLEKAGVDIVYSEINYFNLNGKNK